MLFALLNWPSRRPLWAVGFAAVAVALSLLSVSRLRMDSSLESFFSPREPAARAMGRVLEEFPTAEKLLILASTPGEEAQPEKLLAFAERLRQRVALDPQAASVVGDVTYRADAQSRDLLAKVIVPNAIFYLSDEEFLAARRRLKREAMDEQFRQDAAMLAAPGPAAGAISRAILQDPLRLHEFLQAKLATAQPMKTYQGSDALLSEDGRSLLIGLTGTRPPSDMAFCGRISTAVRKLADEVNTDHLALEYSGAYAIAAQSERSIRRDSISSVVGSVICLGLLFGIAFRRPIVLFILTFTSLALGVLAGFGVYAAFTQSVSPLTAVIGAILAGIGIDYAIFYLMHYLERRDQVAGAPQAAGETIRSIGGALLAAWVTSIVGFIAVGFASVRVLRDFSIAGSLGLAGALLGAIFLLPALLVLVEKLRDRRTGAVNGADHAMEVSNHGSSSNASSGRGGTRLGCVAPLVEWIDRHALACLTSSLALLLIAGGHLLIAGPRLPLETDPTVLHPRPNPPLDAEAHIARVMGGANDSLIVYLQAESPEQLLTLAHQVNERLGRPPAKAAGVSSTFGLATLLPDPSLVARRLAETGPVLAGQVQADFDAAISESDLSPQAYGPYRNFLKTLLTPASAPGVRHLLPYGQLAQTVLPRQSASGPVPREAITLVFMKPTAGTSAVRESGVAELRESLRDLPGATLTGMTVLSLDSQATIRRDLPRLIIAAVGFIAVYLLLHFRSLPLAMLAVLPTLCSILLLLAVARVSGARMNLANIVSIPLLIGIDTDYGIFLVSIARRTANRIELRRRVVASGQAVILCASATLLGFGSLAFTSVPAIRSLGIAVAIGVSTCAAATLFLLLPILLWRSGRESDAQGV